MQHAFQAFLAAAAAHPELALLCIGLIAFAESLAIVGTLVPAGVFMFAAGALVGQGTLPLLATLAGATVGAIAGDALSFELGRHQGEAVRSAALFRQHAERVAAARDFISRRGAGSIVLARFTGPLRAFVPLLAGLGGMRPLRFYIANVGSALLWAPAHILPGVAFGASLQLAEAASARLMMLLLVLAAVLAVAAWLVTRGRRWLGPKLAWLRDHALAWARRRQSLPGRAVLALLDPERPGSQELLLSLLLLVGAMWLFFGTLEDLISGDPLTQADNAVFTFLQGLRTQPADRLMVRITEMGSVGVILPLVVVVLGWLAWKRAWRTAGYWVATVASAELLVQVLKFTLGRRRPLALYQGNEQFSFPSGHATMSIVALAFLGFLLTHRQSRRWRNAVALVVALFAALVAFSRLYLGAHWLSDVLGGLSFGLAWVALAAMVYSQHAEREPIAPRPLAGCALATLAVAGGLWMHWRLPADLQRYALRVQPRQTSTAAWLAGEWHTLPQQRRELGGDREEPFTLQVACPEEQLRAALAASGWAEAPQVSLKTTLLAIAPHPELADLPVLPKFDGGRRSALLLAQPADAATRSRPVLRLWRSELRLDAAQVPVWYGAFYLEQQPRPGWGWIRERPAAAAPLAGLQAVARPVPEQPVLLSCAAAAPTAAR